MQIDTQRLVLRKITMEDAQDIFEYSKGEQVGHNAGWKPHESLEETKEIMKIVFIPEEYVYGIVLKETGRMIGSIGLIADPKREYPQSKMLGYALGQAYWSKGYMTEAVHAVITMGFCELSLEIISAYCYPNNERSKRVMQKNGFQYEGILRMAEVLYDGTVLDNECYSITKEEFSKGINNKERKV